MTRAVECASARTGENDCMVRLLFTRGQEVGSEASRYFGIVGTYFFITGALHMPAHPLGGGLVTYTVRPYLAYRPWNPGGQSILGPGPLGPAWCCCSCLLPSEGGPSSVGATREQPCQIAIPAASTRAPQVPCTRRCAARISRIGNLHLGSSGEVASSVLHRHCTGVAQALHKGPSVGELVASPDGPATR